MRNCTQIDAFGCIIRSGLGPMFVFRTCTERERDTKINTEIQHIKLAVLNFNTPSWYIRTSTFSSLSEPELVSYRADERLDWLYSCEVSNWSSTMMPPILLRTRDMAVWCPTVRSVSVWEKKADRINRY